MLAHPVFPFHISLNNTINVARKHESLQININIKPVDTITMTFNHLTWELSQQMSHLSIKLADGTRNYTTHEPRLLLLWRSSQVEEQRRKEGGNSDFSLWNL